LLGLCLDSLDSRKSEQLHATERVLFSFLRHPSVDAFGTDEVNFVTLIKSNWFLGILLSHKPFLLDICPVSGSLVDIPRWLPVDGFEVLQQCYLGKKTDVFLPISDTRVTQKI
jgi:hypothetical protein